MDTAQWPQERVANPMGEMVVPRGTTCSKQQQQPLPSSSLERKMRPQKEQAINCPRCNSTNTKFCYYNNYSLSQPRYFCKTCRRYWTEGGSLRNIPVGGGSRKNKRSSSSSSPSTTILTSSNTSISSNPNHISSPNPTSSNPKNLPDLILHHHQNPNGQDLNLGFSNTAHDFKTISELIQVPNFSSFLPMHIPSDVPNSVFSSSGFSLPEFKPSSLGFSLDGLGIGGGGGYGSLHGVQESSGRLLFPFEDLKQGSNATASGDQNRDQNGIAGDSTAGYWSGILGGGEGGGGGGGGEGSW